MRRRITFTPLGDRFYRFQNRFCQHVSRRAAFLLLASFFALSAAASASASELIDRGASGVHLQVNAQGQALLTYSAHGSFHRVVAWGAINARTPNPKVPQVHLRKDYSGRSWASAGSCRKYDGPALAWLVTACAAPDGSYWALQSWRRTLPNFGGAPSSRLGTRELRLSHWTGETAKLEAWTDWVYGGRYHHLFGRLTYAGQPVYGFSATKVGSPLDDYGRNIYVDTFDSRYGKGWRRENAFLAHRPTGVFCYGFYPFTSRGPGNGSKYRLNAVGPGVTPDVSIVIPGLHDFDRNNPGDVAYENQQNALQDSITAGDKKCRTH
jgi:hypothetical protein